MVARGSGNSSVGTGRLGLLGRISGVTDGDDLDHRDPRLAPAGLVEGHAADSPLGCGSVRHLADQFRPQQYPLARRRLLHSGWALGSSGPGSGGRLSQVRHPDRIASLTSERGLLPVHDYIQRGFLVAGVKVHQEALAVRAWAVNASAPVR